MKKLSSQNRNFYSIVAVFIIIGLFSGLVLGQIPGTEKRYIRIGQLQSKFSAYGFERAWNNQYYEGMVWPADYPLTDNAVIERPWAACENFTDKDGTDWINYGIYFTAGYVGTTEPYRGSSLFPVVMEQKAKIPLPTVYVDGINVNAPYINDYDELDPSIIPDRIVTNVVNTSMGLTMTKKIYAFSQQYHDDYFIKEYVFKNTGNVDYDDDIELNAPLTGLRIGWGVRYAVSREGARNYDNQQSWGKHSWVSRRGEDYPAHATETITEADGIVDWLRCAFSWAGQSELRAYDNIGSPDLNGNGRLSAPQFAGTVIIHVDRSATDKTDDPNQPAVLGWHAGDTFPALGNLTVQTPMIELYSMLSGNPHQGLGHPSERFDEVYLPARTSRVDPWLIHNDGGGTNIWISYGPFDLNPGDSIRIVEAEAVNGLSREMCEQIGRRWKQAYDNPSDTGPFTLPDQTTTTDLNVYKNEWFYTGIDSILQVFGRAKRNFDLNYGIPQPPLPPQLFEVQSGGDRIQLTWSPSESESDPDFGGYRVFRAVGKPDTSYDEIFACGVGTANPQIVNSFLDITPIRGFDYYYYLVAFNDGSNNTSGAANPTGQLHSGRFYTQTTEPAQLKRKAGESLSDIRVVPNPFNFRADRINYPDRNDRIAFLDIPAFCTIRIYTERGDLIETIEHDDGSGDEFWDSITSSRQIVVSGVYIAHFEVTRDFIGSNGQLVYRKGDSAYRKFVIIR